MRRHRVVTSALVLSVGLLAPACSDVDTTVGLAVERSRARLAEADPSGAALTGEGALPPAVPERRAPSSPEEEAVAEAVRLVFDPAVPFAEAAPHLVSPAEVEATRQTFAALTAGIGAFEVAVGDVEVGGSRARFVVDVYAGGRPVQVGLAGEAVRSEGTWQLGTATFCRALASLPLLLCP